jgi:hypothetical protein
VTTQRQHLPRNEQLGGKACAEAWCLRPIVAEAIQQPVLQVGRPTRRLCVCDFSYMHRGCLASIRREGLRGGFVSATIRASAVRSRSARAALSWEGLRGGFVSATLRTWRGVADPVGRPAQRLCVCDRWAQSGRGQRRLWEGLRGGFVSATIMLSISVAAGSSSGKACAEAWCLRWHVLLRQWKGLRRGLVSATGWSVRWRRSVASPRPGAGRPARRLCICDSPSGRL